MNCERVKKLIADALAASLEDPAKAELEVHLRDCASCREETASLQSIWAKLSSLPQKQPSPALDARIQGTIEAYRQGMNQAEREISLRQTVAEWLGNLWPKQPAWQLAAAILFFALGLFLGTVGIRGPRHDLEHITTDHPAFAELRGEISTMKQLVTLSLLQQPSPSERLRGMEWTVRLDEPGEQVFSALLRVLDFDPNINVRLAAVGALQQFVEDSRVRRGLLEALAHPQSPMVQIGLINVLVRAKEKESVTVLKAMLQKDEIDQTVRKHVEWALQKLS